MDADFVRNWTLERMKQGKTGRGTDQVYRERLTAKVAKIGRYGQEEKQTTSAFRGVY